MDITQYYFNLFLLIFSPYSHHYSLSYICYITTFLYIFQVEGKIQRKGGIYKGTKSHYENAEPYRVTNCVRSVFTVYLYERK